MERESPFRKGHPLVGLHGPLPQRFLEYCRVRYIGTAEGAYFEIGCPALHLREVWQSQLGISAEQMDQLDGQLQEIVEPAIVAETRDFTPANIQPMGVLDPRSPEQKEQQDRRIQAAAEETLRKIQAIPWEV